MTKFLAFVQTLSPHESKYWFGLLLLFVGLSVGVSVATALIVTGAVIACESLLTSYIAGWIKAGRIS